MNLDDEQLVQRIAEQVIKALGQPGAPAPVHPPAGQCTGDYAKFTDRPDLAPEGRQDPPPAAPVLRGIITAQQLQEAVAKEGIATIAADARLTPLAADYAREHPSQVSRAAASASAPGFGPRYLYWAAGHCPAVQELASSHPSQLLPSAAARSSTGLLQAIRDLAAGVSRGDVAGGLLFVDDAARATVLANACPALRAVTGRDADAVRRAIESVAPNVLVIEHTRIPVSLIGSMAELMLAHDPRPSPTLVRELETMRRQP